MKIKLPADTVRRKAVFEAFCSEYGYKKEIDNPALKVGPGELPKSGPKTISNPETPKEFTKRKLKEYIQSVVRMHTIKKAVDKAREDVEIGLDSKLEGIDVVDNTPGPV